MLLGVFNTYTELTARVDKAVRHWQNDFYVQDNWRVTPRLTLDYGVRVQHSGSDYEVNDNHTGFFVDQWNRNQAARVYKLVVQHRRSGDQACAAGNQRAVDPANPTVFLSSAFNGNIVPNSGNFINGVSTDGISGAKPGTYFTFPYFVAAPRVGMAWNVTGDGKTALRASAGIFYNFPRSTGTGGYHFAGGCPVSCSNQIRWATFDDIAAFASGSSAVQLVQTPVNVNVGDFRPAARQVVQRQRRVPARHRLQHRSRDRLRRQLPVRTRTHGRCQPAAALRLWQLGEPGEQRADEHELAAPVATARTRAWDR